LTAVLGFSPIPTRSTAAAILEAMAGEKIQIKPGTRLRSAVCDTELMVIAAPADAIELTCGGATVIDIAGEPPAGATLADDAQDGTLMGKRYVNESGDLELLCTKPGAGSLALAGQALGVKGAKPLPSSD
jgi:hypothetical protein